MHLERTSKKIEQLFFLALFVSFLIGTSIVYIFNFNNPPIRSDGVGYYAYLPSLFIYGDPTMKEFVDVYKESTQHKISPKDLGLIANEDSSAYLDKYPMGVSAMMMPYFFAGHVSSWLVHFIIPSVKPDGINSPFYHFFIAFGSSLYMLLGLLLLKKILDKYFSIKAVYLTLILIIFGTNLFHYATYDSIFSHAYSFFLFAAFIRLTQLWYHKPERRFAILIGIIGGLIILVRPTNVVIVLIFLFYGIEMGKLKYFLKDRIHFFKKNIGQVLSMILIAFIFILPQLIYWKYITGSWLVFSYQGEGFNFMQPEIRKVLFSTNKGLFFWAPALLFIIPGIFIMRKRDELNRWIFPIVTYFGITVYLIASWWWWSYGGSYGHRGFIESFVILAIPLAAFFDYAFKHVSIGSQRIVMGICTVCVGLCMYMMLQYWRGYLPYDGTTWDIYLNALRNVDVVNR
jgi:hypothetical protein